MERHDNEVSENCNHCNYRDCLSKHWDIEDYCSFNKKKIGKINVEHDCPLRMMKS